MRNQKGVTLATVILMIVVMVIIASTSVIVGNRLINEAKERKKEENRLEVEAAVSREIAKMNASGVISPGYHDFIGTKNPIIARDKNDNPIYAGEDWYLLNESNLINLGVKGVNDSFLVNYGTGEILLIDDIKEWYLDVEIASSNVAIYQGGSDTVTYSDGVYTIHKASNYNGMALKTSLFQNGKTYILRYKIQKTDGELYNIGGHAQATTQISFTIDGNNSTGTYGNPGHNMIDDSNEHIIEYKFNYNSTGISNAQVYIQPNRARTTAITANISDISLQEVVEL